MNKTITKTINTIEKLKKFRNNNYKSYSIKLEYPLVKEDTFLTYDSEWLIYSASTWAKEFSLEEVKELLNSLK